jgi:hypothetical protein
VEFDPPGQRVGKGRVHPGVEGGDSLLREAVEGREEALEKIRAMPEHEWYASEGHQRLGQQSYRSNRRLKRQGTASGVSRRRGRGRELPK